MSDEYPAYSLAHDFSQLGDTTADAHLVEYPGSERVFWLTASESSFPGTVYFEANFEALRRTDFPVTKPNWPVMSKRMIEVLQSVGPLPPHRSIPVTMLDYTVKTSQRLDAAGVPRSGVADDRFVCLQLLAFADAFDWERSDYEPHKRLPGRVKLINKLVLKQPPEGFPPLFRMSAAPTAVLVSAEARRALEAAKIQGCCFELPTSILF